MTSAEAAETVLVGGVFATTPAADSLADLRALVDDIGHRSFEARRGRRGRPEQFDETLWRHLEDTGLTRLTSTPDLDASPSDVAVVLHRLAYYAGAAPVAETDLLAGWLGLEAALELPAAGPMTVAIADANSNSERVSGTAIGVPWTRTAAAVVLVARTSDGVHAGVVDTHESWVVDDHNLAGEPRDRITFDVSAQQLSLVDTTTYNELVRRGAWARCVQVIGALDAVAASSVSHCRERIQFGQPLSKLQSVQHSLASMAGQVEKGRAAVELAVAAASVHGFASVQTDYAVTVAKVVLARVSDAVVTAAHQLHGAIGISIEHPLWLSTTRAQSWIREFGSSAHYARRLGHLVLQATEPWDVLIGRDLA
jgi:acyl-CoA dehydrogenase